MFVIAIGLLMLMYVINYGKILDWMSSYKICAYIVIAPILIAFFVWMQYHSETPYVNLAPLYQPKAIVGYFYMMLIMFFSTSTTLLTNYMTSILKVDSTHSYVLYIWLLPGYILGAFICFWWFRWQRWRFRFFIAGGMARFAIFFGILYFGISPESTYEMLFFPIFLRGLGMLALIIAFALFAVEDLNPKFLLSNAFFLIIFRSVLAPIIATSFYSNTLYRLQQKYMHSLSETITMLILWLPRNSHNRLQAAWLRDTNIVKLPNWQQPRSILLCSNRVCCWALKEILGWLFIITLIIALFHVLYLSIKQLELPLPKQEMIWYNKKQNKNDYQKNYSMQLGDLSFALNTMAARIDTLSVESPKMKKEIKVAVIVPIKL